MGLFDNIVHSIEKVVKVVFPQPTVEYRYVPTIDFTRVFGTKCKINEHGNISYSRDKVLTGEHIPGKRYIRYRPNVLFKDNDLLLSKMYNTTSDNKLSGSDLHAILSQSFSVERRGSTFVLRSMLLPKKFIEVTRRIEIYFLGVEIFRHTREVYNKVHNDARDALDPLKITTEATPPSTYRFFLSDTATKFNLSSDNISVSRTSNTRLLATDIPTHYKFYNEYIQYIDIKNKKKKLAKINFDVAFKILK